MKLRDVTYIEEFPHEVFRGHIELIISDPEVKGVVLDRWIRLRFPQDGPRMIAGLLVSSMGLTR